jgi:hypothetical protein
MQKPRECGVVWTESKLAIVSRKHGPASTPQVQSYIRTVSNGDRCGSYAYVAIFTSVKQDMACERPHNYVASRAANDGTTSTWLRAFNSHFAAIAQHNIRASIRRRCRLYVIFSGAHYIPLHHICAVKFWHFDGKRCPKPLEFSDQPSYQLRHLYFASRAHDALAYHLAN